MPFYLSANPDKNKIQYNTENDTKKSALNIF